MTAIESVNVNSLSLPLSLESSMVHLTTEQQKLYQCIKENRTEEAMETFALPSLGINDEKIKFIVNKKTYSGAVGCDTKYWSMMQWACYHGNEKVSVLNKNIFLHPYSISKIK